MYSVVQCVVTLISEVWAGMIAWTGRRPKLRTWTGVGGQRLCLHSLVDDNSSKCWPYTCLETNEDIFSGPEMCLS